MLTGLRCGELFALRWRDLDEDEDALTVGEAVYLERVPRDLSRTPTTPGPPATTRREGFELVPQASLTVLCPRGDATPTVTSYRDDPLYPRIAHAVDALLKSANVVAVDVLIGMELLTREQLEDWHRGRVPYLERIINCNLTQLGRLLRILRFHAHALNLKPSWTAYIQWEKGPKQRLRFSKTGDPKVEEAYATHFVWPGKGPFHARAAKDSSP